MVRALARQLGIELLFLPSHSPNQHLIKRLGKFTKKRAPHSRHHINDASIDTCLDHLPTTSRPLITPLLTVNFQSFNNVPMLPA